MLINILLLLISTIIWGFGFIATRWTLESYDPFWATALRFLLAGTLSLPFIFYKKSFWRKDNILIKSLIGSIFLLGMLLLQTIGLASTTVAKSGFITTLYSLLIPITMMAISGKKYRKTFWILIFMSLLGMGLMCNLEFKDLNSGDFYTFLCAMSAAFHIIYIGKIASEIQSPIEFNFLQNIFVGIFSTIIAYFFKGPIHLITQTDIYSKAFLGFVILGVFSSMVAFTIQIIAQKKIPVHIAGLIFLLESPFAAFFGYFIFREILSPLNILGAGLIVLSVILVPIIGREVTATD